jgi:hypothetical protein
VGELFTFVDEFQAMSHEARVFIKVENNYYRPIISNLKVKPANNDKVYKLHG